MANFKEIVTKAVVGKAKKTTTSHYSITPSEKVDTVLGCWVINHTFQGKGNRGIVDIQGEFDVNVWYAYDHDTKTSVSTGKFQYTDHMNVPLKDGEVIHDASEVIVHSLKQPTVVNVEVVNGTVVLDIEKELGVEVVGNTKLKVPVEEDYDDYEEIVDEDAENASIEGVTDEYLN